MASSSVDASPRLFIGGHVTLDTTVPKDYTFQCFLHNTHAHFTPTMIKKWAERGIKFPVGGEERAKRLAHCSYVTYPWSITESTHTASIRDVQVVSQCCNLLGIQYENVHFSRDMGADPVFSERFVECMKVVEPPCTLLFECIGTKPNTPPGGSTPIEWINTTSKLMEKLWPLDKDTAKWGLCLDTAHLFAIGQPLTTKEDANAMIKLVSENKMPVKALHLNGSRSEFNSGVDLHSSIGSPLDNIWGKDMSGVKRILEWAMEKRLAVILERPKFNKPSHYLAEVETLKKLIGLGY